MGDVMGDINARRGQISGTDIRNGAAIITANVPLSTMFGLRHRPAQQDAGARQLQHGAQPLRGTAKIPAGKAYRQPGLSLDD